MRVVAVALLCVYGALAHPNYVLESSLLYSSEDPLMPVNLHLTQRNLDLLHSTFVAISDPRSARYAKYLSPEQIADISAPLPYHIDQVKAFVSKHGAQDITLSRTRDVLRCLLPASAVGSIFNVNVQPFASVSDSTNVIYRSEDLPTIPAELSSLVDVVHGVRLPPPIRRRKRASPSTLSPLVDAVKNADGTPNSVLSPMFISRGGGIVSVSYSVSCADGSPSTTNPPCSGDSDALTAVNLAGVPTLPHSANKDVDIMATPSCSVVSGLTVCHNTFEPVPLFEVYNYSLNTVYKSGAAGPKAFAPFSSVATAPVTPQLIAEQYSIPPSYRATNGSQAVVEFEQQYYSPSDLDRFFELFGFAGPETPIHVVGPNNASNPGGEANLDIQYLLGVASGVDTTFWSIKATSSVEIDDILSWANAMLNDPNPPLVNSISYGMTESAVDKYQGAGYLNRSDVAFKQLAMRGITVLIADGDTGAGDLGAPPMSIPTCANGLHADWPSQSPYVTAVGSTYFTPIASPACYSDINCMNNPIGEVTTSLDSGLFWTTGGGFSGTAERPWYQNNSVLNYFANNATTGALPPVSVIPNGGNGRGYGDVVAVGHNLMVVLDGQLIPVDGTSASAPVFAGVLSLLNDARLNNGLAPLGFVNPMLYHLSETVEGAFYDVVVGDNRCGALGQAGVPDCCDHAYKCAVGWDAVSGLGSPNFAVMKEAVLKL